MPSRLSQYPWGRLRSAYGREGVWSVAQLAEAHGAEIDLGDLLRILTWTCWYQRPPEARPSRQYEPRCLAHYPDLYEPELTPPAPPAPALRVVGDRE